MFNVITILISQTWEIFDYSVTRLDDFLFLLATNFLTKLSQILSDFLGYFEKNTFLS